MKSCMVIEVSELMIARISLALAASWDRTLLAWACLQKLRLSVSRRLQIEWCRPVMMCLLSTEMKVKCNVAVTVSIIVMLSRVVKQWLTKLVLVVEKLRLTTRCIVQGRVSAVSEESSRVSS